MSSQKELLDEYRGKLQIDRNDLDTVAAEQPKLFHDVAYQMVKSRSNLEYSKDELKRVCAELSLEIRKDLEDAGEKITEGRVDAEMRQRKTHVAAKELAMTSQRDADMWEILKDSFAERGRMLKQLAELWVGGYYQNAGVRATERKITDAKYDKARDKIKTARKQLRE